MTPSCLRCDDLRVIVVWFGDDVFRIPCPRCCPEVADLVLKEAGR